MTVQSLLLAIHLLGCTLGVGASTILDLRVLQLLTGRIVTDEDIAFATFLSRFVRLGLLLLWLSGLCFLVRYWLFTPELLSNPKLHAKIAVVLTLTLNGVLIEGFAMPFLLRQRGRALFDGLALRAQIAVLVIGTVSATSWYTAFGLGLLREWNFTMPSGTILALYAGALAAGCCVSVLGRRMLYRPESTHPQTVRRIAFDSPAKPIAVREDGRAGKRLAGGGQSALAETPAEFAAVVDRQRARIRQIMLVRDLKDAMK